MTRKNANVQFIYWTVAVVFFRHNTQESVYPLEYIVILTSTATIFFPPKLLCHWVTEYY